MMEWKVELTMGCMSFQAQNLLPTTQLRGEHNGVVAVIKAPGNSISQNDSTIHSPAPRHATNPPDSRHLRCPCCCSSLSLVVVIVKDNNTQLRSLQSLVFSRRSLLSTTDRYD